MRKQIFSLCMMLIMIISICCVQPSSTAEADTVCRVVYNSTRGKGLPSAQIVEAYSYFNVSSKIPTCTGYIFLYWKRYKTQENIYPGESYYFDGTRGTITFDAVWKPETYIIHYDANGGVSAPKDTYATYWEVAELTSEVPFREGYKFVGWGKERNSTTGASPGAKFTYTSASSTTYYAVWKKVYTVKYLANGGINAPNEQTKLQGTSLTLSEKQPTRKGYYFWGWSTDSSDTSVTYLPGDTYTDNASITLYAVWGKSPNVNVKGESNSPNANVKGTNSSNKKDSKETNTIKPAKVKVSLKAGKKKVTVKWSKVKGAMGYTIYYKTSKKGKWKKLKNLSAKKTKYVKKKLKSGKKYYFTVKAYKKVNGKKVYGKFKIKKVKVK